MSTTQWSQLQNGANSFATVSAWQLRGHRRTGQGQGDSFDIAAARWTIVKRSKGPPTRLHWPWLARLWLSRRECLGFGMNLDKRRQETHRNVEKPWTKTWVSEFHPFFSQRDCRGRDAVNAGEAYCVSLPQQRSAWTSLVSRLRSVPPCQCLAEKNACDILCQLFSRPRYFVVFELLATRGMVWRHGARDVDVDRSALSINCFLVVFNRPCLIVIQQELLHIEYSTVYEYIDCLVHSFSVSGNFCSALDASQGLCIFDIRDKSDAEAKLTRVTTNLLFLKHAATLECRTCRASFTNEVMCSAWTSFAAEDFPTVTSWLGRLGWS